MSTKSKGTEYEKYIEKICKSINSYSNFNLIELKQDKKIIGLSGVEHRGADDLVCPNYIRHKVYKLQT